MSPIPGSPAGPPRRERPISRVLYISFWIPSKGAPPLQFPLTELPQREMLHFWSPPSTIKVPSKWTSPPGSPMGPLQRKTNPFPVPSSSHLLITHLFLKVPSMVAPVHVHPTGSLWREMLHLQSQWFIHSFIAVRVPS